MFRLIAATCTLSLKSGNDDITTLYEVARPLSNNLKGGWSSRQGCDPAGESPAVSVARVGYVAIPHLGAGNQPSDAWCKRPGRLVVIPQRWVQSGGLASMGART